MKGREAIAEAKAELLEVLGEGVAVLNAEDEYFDRRSFWRHSVITAVLAEMLAEPYAEEHPQAFTAGLLHDLGRAVLDQFFAEEWKEVCLEAKRRQTHWLPVERELLGTDHAEVGFWLAEPILRAYGVDDDVVREGAAYLRRLNTVPLVAQKALGVCGPWSLIPAHP